MWLSTLTVPLNITASLLLSGIARHCLLLHLSALSDGVPVLADREPVSDGDKARLSSPSVCRKLGAVTLA